MVELTLNAPWFMLSMEVGDQGEPEHSVTQTLCIAWEYDLADILVSMEAARVTGLICMMPASASASGHWTSREIREVWLHRSAAGRHIELLDKTGQRFDCGLTPDHIAPVEIDLLWRVIPRRQR
ncbi:hypothetical protein ACG04Q_21475 [Roseateles sp. DXS20W]|uniref:Uncharacterized protein n=1 Tax=Pelomonas lactea TaxID=3299030 RepID=A0ABW7GQR1_9BURK